MDYQYQDYPLASNNNSPIDRRMVIFAAVGLLLIAVISMVIWAYMHGRVSLDINQLKIEPDVTIVDSSGKTVVNTTGYQVDQTLPTGDYVAYVVSGVNKSEKAFTVGSFLTKTEETVEVIDSHSVIPITNTPVYKPQITDDGMRFIDLIVGQLGEYRNENVYYYSLGVVSDVAWVNDTSGYIVTRSTEGTALGLLNDQSMRNIRLPVHTRASISIKYHNDSLYLIIGNQLYRYKDDKFSRLFEVAEGSTITMATDDLIGVTSTPRHNLEAKDINLKITNHQGDVQLESNLGEAETISLWSSAIASEDGSMIAVGNQGSVSIYSSDNLSEPLYNLPAGNIGTVAWANNNLVYATGDTMWRYTPDQKLAQSIIELLPYMNISEILTHGDDIYIVNQKTTSSSVLKVAEVTDDTHLVAEMMDGSETTFVDPVCFFNYFYFDTPRIFVHQAHADITRCIDPITRFYQSIGLEASDLIINRSIGDYELPDGPIDDVL